jgi:hypothetical protein
MEKKEVRKQRQIRATDEEWEIFRRFARMIKRADKDAVIKALDGIIDLQPKEPTAIQVEQYQSSLESVYTIAEAVDKWGVSYSALKAACSGNHDTPPRLKPYECRKSARTWLITRLGIERLYGKPKK